jgi:beta-N-acetylhexosaminidase
MVGQMVMAGMDGQSPSSALLSAVRRGHIGGIILFADNISPQLPAALALLQRTAASGHNPPLLISVDQEGGPIRRFPNAPPAVGPREMSSTSQAFHQGLATGSFLTRHGVNVDLAPVSDVTLSKSGFEIGQDRGFAGGPSRVASLASAFTRGLQRTGVAATAKHFPGIGMLTTDSDFQLSSIGASVALLRNTELVPFTREIREGVKLVMVANAIYPSLSGRPAGFSTRIIGGLLKGSFGFKGVVITDALDTPPELGGTYGSRAVRAARAGADIILFAPASAGPEAFGSLLGAARSGTLRRSRLQDAYRRVLVLKRSVIR